MLMHILIALLLSLLVYSSLTAYYNFRSFTPTFGPFLDFTMKVFIQLWCISSYDQNVRVSSSYTIFTFCRFIAAGCQLAKSMEPQSLNELGFSKRYVRYLQVIKKLFWCLIINSRGFDVCSLFNLPCYFFYCLC